MSFSSLRFLDGGIRAGDRPTAPSSAGGGSERADAATPSTTSFEPRSWQRTHLPATWADRLSPTTPAGLWAYLSGPLRTMLSPPRPVRLPPDLPGGATLPEYLLQEFHGTPNGYYSTSIALAYARGFELVMLLRMRRLRAAMAARLGGCDAVLDVGCGAGRLADAVQRRGAPDVWGLDPSPYALNVAAARLPNIRFVQGLAEDTGFASGRFDGVGVCFVLHELPRPVLERSLAEFHRILRPRGLLVMAEPSPLHIRGSWSHVVRRYGVLGAYFKALAGLVFEPFLSDWMAVDLEATLARYGFVVESDRCGVPFREVVARREGT